MTDLKNKTIENYVHSIYELCNIVINEYELETLEFGSYKSLELLIGLRDKTEWETRVMVASENINNFRALNEAGNRRYNATLNYYEQYVEFVNTFR